MTTPPNWTGYGSNTANCPPVGSTLTLRTRSATGCGPRIKAVLEALPSSNPARTVTGIRHDDTGRALTEGDHWATLDSAGRRTWLTSGEFRIIARRAGYGQVAVELDYLGDDTD